MKRTVIAKLFQVNTVLLLASVCLLILLNPCVFGQQSIQIDASQFREATPSSFHGGSSTSSSGHTLGLNSRYLIRDGKPWLPVMGEFHYTRVPETEWEEEILKAKAAGINILATYVIWIHHEEVEGKFDWTGQRDLHRFVDLCAKHGMYVYVRIGPWAHGEARNGGFPDWLIKAAPNNRSNDPTYLSYVETYYDAIGDQLRGELWKDGGAVIGVQLENEYSKTGPGAGEAHILELKKLALRAGLDVPLYSVTGWDGAVVPHGAVVAVFGGYPDAPWDASLHDLPPQEVYAFRFGSRVTGNMGMMGMKASSDLQKTYDFPFMTAEMGGGIQDTYHRRPVLRADDVAAMVPVMLGSGVNLYGSYMFQGGENPDGKRSTLEESQRTGYPTDVPVKSYDFQAPLGEFGQEREVLRKLKVFDYFMNQYGPGLAPMQAYAPAVLPDGPQDLSVPRLAVRANGESGFLFFNNYVRNATMPARGGFQVKVKLAEQTLALPAKPITLPSGVYGIWPLNLQIGGAKLRYATAEPLTCFSMPDADYTYFVQTPGVSAEFLWEQKEGVKIIAHTGKNELTPSDLRVYQIPPAKGSAFTIIGPQGRRTEVVLISQNDAEEAWRVEAAKGSAHLLFTEDEFWNDGPTVHLDSMENPAIKFQVSPDISTPVQSSAPIKAERTPGGEIFTAIVPAVHPVFTVTAESKAGTVPAVQTGPPVSWRKGVAMAPDDTAFHAAAHWQLKIAPGTWTGVRDLFLKIAYDGDVARLSSHERLLEDNFFNGQTWEVGLRRFRSQISAGDLDLAILPRRSDAPIFLEKAFRSATVNAQVIQLGSVQLIPEYEVSFQLP